MIKSWPLYPNSEDVWEEPPITPNNILIDRHSCPSQPEQEARVIPRHLLRVSKTELLNFGLVGWGTLLHRCCLETSGFVKENVKIGDLVLELNPHRNRLQWEMALIVDWHLPRRGWISQEGAHQGPEWRVGSPHTQTMRHCYKARVLWRRTIIRTIFTQEH